MARRTVTTVDATYTVVDAERLGVGALLIVPLLDAASGRRLTEARVRTDHPHAAVRVASGGYLIVLGRADLVFPRLATANETIVVELQRPGRLPEAQTFTVPLGSALPLVLPDLEVEGPPLGVAGTVTTAAHPHNPVADATVRASLPDAGPPFALALRTPLARTHPPGSMIRSRGLNPAAATTLDGPVAGGATTVVLVSVAGCAAGRILALGAAADVEHLVIEAVDAPTRTVTLRSPLVRSRPDGAPAEAFTLGAAGAGVGLDRPVRAGDGLVLTAADLAAEAVVELLDPDPLRHEVRATNGRTDGIGRYRVQGIRGLERLGLTPEGPVPPPGPTVVVLLDPVVDPVRADLTL